MTTAVNNTASSIHPFSPLAQRLSAAKAAYNTRMLNMHDVHCLITENATPRSGDLLLARVNKLGHHRRIELQNGRKAILFEGDEIIVCYGNRYAPDQFEAEIPADLNHCHLVAAGGIASRSLSKHGKTRQATEIQPLGLLGDNNGKALNIANYALAAASCHKPRPFVIAVAGTSMNAGKTTSAAYLIKGMARAGLKVGAAKITGTGAGGDRWLMKDAGACAVLDFTDTGLASTYKADISQLEQIQTQLIAHLQQAGAEAVVLEIADGLYQQETNALLRSKAFQKNIDALLFAAGDAMGASGGAEWLKQHKLPLVALSGCVSASPLAAREAQLATDLPVLGLNQLASSDIIIQLFESGVEWVAKQAKVS